MSQFLIASVIDKERALRAVSLLDLTKPWSITIERPKKSRTLSQSALLHKWFSIVADDVGDDAESVKDDFKAMFLDRVERKTLSGVTIHQPKRTRDLTTKEMSDFMNKVEAFATSQLGIILPVPEDLHEVRR